MGTESRAPGSRGCGGARRGGAAPPLPAALEQGAAAGAPPERPLRRCLGGDPAQPVWPPPAPRRQRRPGVHLGSPRPPRPVPPHPPAPDSERGRCPALAESVRSRRRHHRGLPRQTPPRSDVMSAGRAGPAGGHRSSAGAACPPSPHPLGPGTGHLPAGRGTPLHSSVRPSVRSPASPPPGRTFITSGRAPASPAVCPAAPPARPAGPGPPAGAAGGEGGKSTQNPLGAAAAAPGPAAHRPATGLPRPRRTPARSPRSVPAAALPVPPVPPAPGGGPGGAARTHLLPAGTRWDRDRAGAAEPPGPSQPDRRRGRKDRAVIAARARPPAEGTAGPGSRAPRAASGGTDTRGDTGRGFGCRWHRLFGL